jgi:hypothetical protein
MGADIAIRLHSRPLKASEQAVSQGKRDLSANEK